MGVEGNAARLTGKVALITGGAGNIGEMITRRYLEEGATVVISGRNDERLQRYRDQLVSEAGVSAERVVAARMDGSDMDQVRAGVASIVERFGRIDILVNNAGSAGARQRLPDIPLVAADLQAGDSETLQDGIGNLVGISWNLVRAVAPHMPAGGSIINVSTIFSRTDYFGRIPYVVPKAALNALSLGLANELGPRGVRVNMIYPGPIDSERIRTVFRRMDELKGLPESATAEGFFAMMRLSRPDAAGNLVKSFPKTIDIANAAVFLGSDESAALSGETLEVTHGMAVPVESRTTFVARPGLRAVDGSRRTVLICVGDQIEEALALTGVLRACSADVVLGFRSRAAIAQVEHILDESRRMPGRNYTPPILLYLDPLVPVSVDAALNWIAENLSGPNSVLILPARAEAALPVLATATDEAAARFLQEELAGVMALSSRLARFWQAVALAPAAEALQPRVLFMSNPDDGKGNLYADMLRAGVEQLVRVWRHEAQLDHARAQADPANRLPPVWANQLVRYVNREEENLEFACAWAAKLLLSDRRVDEINLYLPVAISATTGAQRPSFGWAESLIGLHLGRVALITGGSAGIGGQIGRLLALSGARVMLAARDADKLDQMRQYILRELEEVGYNDVATRVQIFPNCDVADEAQLAALVERTVGAFGHVDYLINNAGISGAEEMVIDLPLSSWRATLNANLISNFSLIRKLAPLMKAQGSGYILNVSSYFGGEKHAAISYPNRADYAVSKAGQRALAEALARLLGPEVQINALAPGPVEGDRLRGTGERPGLFVRRARLILENKRLNELHSALIETHRSSALPVSELLAPLLRNNVEALAADPSAPEPLRKLATTIWQEGDPQAASRAFFANQAVAEKLLHRLQTGGYLLPELGASPGALMFDPAAAPPEPFFARGQIEREARKVRDGIMSMIYLQRMPTEFDVAMATVYYLTDRNVSGETFHPSGGLRYERTPMGGELYGQPTAARLAELVGSTVYLIGEHLGPQLVALAHAYIERCGVRLVVLLVETAAGAAALGESLVDHVAAGHLEILIAGDDLEGALDDAVRRFGRPGPVVCTPFRALPTLALVGRKDSDWATALSAQGFAELCEQQFTHHFRVANKVALMDGVALVMVTPETTASSTTDQFALANFVKTTLHAFTATIGVECERTVHRILVNQVDLTRQARSEEPRNEAEHAQELERLIDAVLLTTAPLPPADDSRYSGRIHRGRAITV